MWWTLWPQSYLARLAGLLLTIEGLSKRHLDYYFRNRLFLRSDPVLLPSRVRVVARIMPAGKSRRVLARDFFR